MKPPQSLQKLLLLSTSILFLFFSSSLFAQSPGNVSGNLQVWLKADAGTTLSGSDVTNWADQSGNTNNVSSVSTDPVLLTDDVNFNFAIEFDGDPMRTSAGGVLLANSAYTKIVVFKFDAAVTGNHVVSSNTAGTLLHGDDTSTDLVVEHVGSGVVLTATSVVSTDRYYMATGVYGGGVSNNYLIVDGAQEATNTTAAIYADVEIEIGGQSGADGLDGKIAEIIIYDTDIIGTDLEQIQSYLAIKYGISKSGDYLASDGDPIWDATSNSSYLTDITGIGLDNDSDLDQPKSSSLNSNAILTIANEDITTPSSISSDGSFLIWGNDNAATTFGSGNFTNADGSTSNRMSRVWKVQETGTVGNVEIAFDNSMASGTVSMVIDPADNTFANNAERRVYEMTDNGSEYEVTVDLEDGDFFSFVNESAHTLTTKPILINEVITEAQQDWGGGNFYNSAPGGSGTAGTDEWVELYIVESGLDLTAYTIELNDGTNVSGTLSAGGGAFLTSNYLSTTGGILADTDAGDYLILGNVNGNMNNTNLTINLKNGSGDIIDQVIIGDGSNAPSGNSSNTSNESVSRIPGETDTNDNSNDFSLTRATLGSPNSPTGIVKINEVITDPYRDWQANGFDGTHTTTGTSLANNNEWLELYIEDSGINLTGWTIEVVGRFNGDLTARDDTGTGAFQEIVYYGTGSFTATNAGDYLVLGNPQSGLQMTNDVEIILYNSSGIEVDRVKLGGGASEAPGGANGSLVEESISRYTNASDTDTDDADFIQTIATLGSNNSVTGTVLINEVVTDPQQDWSTNGFDGTVAGGMVTAGTDEWIELYLETAGINLTGWTIELTDGTPISGDLTSTGAFDVSNYFSNTSGSSFFNTAIGDYLVLGNTDGSGQMSNDILITLRDASGTIIDEIELGDDAAGDGVGDGAPDGSVNGGNASGSADEAVARIPNATDTDNDVTDFSSGVATMGASNAVVALSGFSNALDFDGALDFVDLDNAAELSFERTDAFSIEMWVNTTVGSAQWLVTKHDDGFDIGYHVNIRTTGELIFALVDGTNSVINETTGTLIDGEWNHIAVTYSGNNTNSGISIYLNGVLDNTINTAGTLSSTIVNGENVLVGVGPSSNFYFVGEMDELRFWDVERTHEEVLESMFTAQDGLNSDLLAYYNFDQSSSTILPDIAGTNDGSLENMDGSEWTAADWDIFASNQSIVNPITGSDVIEGISDELEIDESVFLNDDGDFILVGHENSDFVEVTSDLPTPAGGTLVAARYDRNWHLLVNDESGTTGGNVTFSFDIGITPNSDYTYYLLERATTSGDFSIVPIIGVNPNGNNVVFTLDADDLNNGYYYTLGRSDEGVGNALDFDGTNDRLVIGNTTDFDWMHGADNTAAFQLTMEFWVKMDDPEFNNLTYLINTAVLSSANIGAGLLYDDRSGSGFDRNLRFYVVNGSGTATIDDSGVNFMYPADANWHHLAVTYDQSLSSDNAKYYLDGVLIREETKDAGTASTSASNFPLTLGAGANTSAFFGGEMDEVRIWDIVRTHEEIVENMYANLAGDQANLRAYYRFNQGIGDGNTSLPDLSVDVNNGTLTNFDNLGASTASSNYVPSDRSTFTSTTMIANGGALTNASDELTITSTESAGDFLQNTGDQVIWGNDAGAFEETADDVDADLLTVARITKTWRVDKNDEVGTADGNMTFSFDLGTAPNPDYAYFLLERTGTSGDFSIAKIFGSEPNGNSIEFTIDGAEVSDENYFTLGRSDSGPGNALDFDGTDDIVTIPDDPILEMSGDFTIEFWWQSSDTGNKIIFEKGTGNTEYSVQQSSSDRLILNIDNAFMQTGNSYNDGNWHHVALIYRSAGDGTIYVDGVEDVSSNATGTPSYSTGALTIGARSGGTHAMDMQIDEIRVWDDERTQSEIENYMHRTLDVASESGLVAYYKFDQGDADDTNAGVDLLTDHSGNDQSGTLSGFGLSGSSSNWTVSEAVVYDAVSNQALIGAENALDFDGTDEYVTASDVASLDITGTLTLEAWVNLGTTPPSANEGIVSKFLTSGNEESYSLDITTGGNVEFTVTDDGSTDVAATSIATVSTSEWTHIAAVYDPSTSMQIFIDGVLDSELTSGVPASIHSGSAALWIGASSVLNANNSLDGTIDEVRIWNTARASTEIQDNMFEELVGDEAGLVAYYRFDEEADAGNTTLFDETTNNNDGTLTNMDGATDWVNATARDAFKTTGATNWSSVTTWKNGEAPTASTDIVNVTHDVTFDASDEVLDLNVNSGVTLTIASSQELTINGNLINNGTITGDGNIIFTTGSSIITGGTISNVTVNGANPELQGETTITGTLTMTSGNLLLDVFDLIVSGSIADASSSSYIQTINQHSSGGSLQLGVANGAGEIVFPVGTSTYTPLTMVNLGTTSDFSIRVFDGHYYGGTSGTAITEDEEIDRTWVVNALGTGFNTTISIQWNVGEEDASFDRNNMFISRNGSRGWWEPISGTIAAGGGDPYSATVSGITSFSEISGGSGSSPLPVELVDFLVQENDGRVELQWSTASEVNNDYFEIERSSNGELFEQIGRIDGNGDSNELLKYAFTDNRPVNGLTYYRLRQVDFDGAFEYSPIRRIQMGNDGIDAELNMYPNPSSDGFTLLLDELQAESVELTLVDFSGKVLKQTVFQSENQSLKIEFGKELPTGIYLLIAEFDGKRMVSRIVKD